MANKILVIANGAPLDICGLFVFALEEKTKNTVNWTGSLINMSYKTKVNTEKIISRYMPTDKGVDLSKFDIILGLDNQCLPILVNIKENFNDKIVGCQILDYPAHVFERNKNYNAGAKVFWDNIKNQIGKIDFIIHNQNIALEILKEHHPNSAYSFIRFPVNPIYFEKFERKDFIIYSGRIHPDKGVHYIIDALSLLENAPKLITIGSGFDFSEYAKYLKVDYENIQNCSEEDKWKLYYECRFLVCGSDNKYIPALSILEGISINRAGIVFDYEESKLHYKENAWYCIPRNIDSLSNCIKFNYENKEQCDNRAIGGSDFYKKECSYSVWAESVISLIESVK